MSYLANLYFYEGKTGRFEPYATIGVGSSRISFDDVRADGAAAGSGITNDYTALSYQIGVGVDIPVRKNLTLDARFRYFDTANITIDQLAEHGHFSSSSVLFGLRYGF